jgi:hypothetical protein
MPSHKQLLRNWNYAGMFTLLVAGTALHYAFAWSGHSKIVALIAPVNESVWEHLKMGYWALIFFSLVEYCNVHHKINNYFLARLTGVLALEITILVIHYGYSLFVSENNLWVDIGSYVVGVINCQFLVSRLQQMKALSDVINMLSISVLTSIALLLGLTTYYPPHYELFKDSRNDTYGIYKEGNE